MVKIVPIPITSSVTAGTEIDISSYVHEDIYKIVSAYLFTGSDGTAAASWTTLTLTDDGLLTTTSPGAGEIALTGRRAITLGSDTTGREILILQYLPATETLKV